MGFNNPAWTWSELEATLSGRRGRDGRPPASPSWNAGGDGPAWTRKRQPFQATGKRVPGEVPYAELHCHSNFSFLDGASHPEELVEAAAGLGLEALALTDHDGFYGVVRFAEAAGKVEVPTVFGAELTLEHDRHLVVLAERQEGYARLSRAISLGQLAGEKEAPEFTLGGVAGEVEGACWVLTGCRKGAVPAALVADGPAAARRELERLVSAFGRDRVFVELWDHGDPLDSVRNDALAELAHRVGVECLATNNVHYARPDQRRLATAIAAVRARTSLDELDPWLPASAAAHLRSGAEQLRRFARYPGVIARAAELGNAAKFDLKLLAPGLPPFGCKPVNGRIPTEMEYLRHLVEEGGLRMYGDRSSHPQAWEVIDHELAVIEELGYPGYFLVVWDLVEFCRKENIFCQGRGSAANSAACYALGITKADPVMLGLLFERFLSAVRDEPPDIDIDIESDRREQVIQYVYDKYGRHHTAQVANVITYRTRSAIRDMARALGHSPGQQDAYARQIDGWGSLDTVASEPDRAVPGQVLDLARQIEDAPRHLGIHSGGMVICDRPIIEVCPVEWARMKDRSVLQWDKDDCAAIKLAKFDLLGLGMLSALRYAVDLIREHRGYEVDIAKLPQEPEVYEMICRADTIGVFQIESRAQMATLPRLQPRDFRALVIEIALIRPGPIQGGSVHPYIRRHNGEEPVTYLHPLLENSLRRTLGVPLFQEQLMQMAIDVAGFTPAESDELRQAMGSKRSFARMEDLKERLYAGMAKNGITGELADELYEKMRAFASYGFPQSHAESFAFLVYSSSWIKYYEPAAFCAALINARPMGFWSPHTLVQDARRHGVTVRSPDLNASLATATLEDGGHSVRLGIDMVRGVGKELAKRIEAERADHGPYVSPENLVRRVPELTLAQLEAMATAGLFGECFGMERREALWAVGAVSQSRPGHLPGIVTGDRPPTLPGMEWVEESVADLWITGVSPDGHPTKFLRDQLAEMGVVTSHGLRTCRAPSRVTVAGVVTHRQRPMTAQGTTFLNLEDETGLINIVVSKKCWKKYAVIARTAQAMLVKGRLERVGEGEHLVVNVVADHLELLALPARTRSRDFR